jgi:hypothetical protein
LYVGLRRKFYLVSDRGSVLRPRHSRQALVQSLPRSDLRFCAELKQDGVRFHALRLATPRTNPPVGERGRSEQFRFLETPRNLL